MQISMGGGSYSIPSGSYRIKQAELSQYQQGNILRIEYDSSDSSFDASACDFELENSNGETSTLLKHISKLLDAYIGPKVTTDLGTLSASFDGNQIVITVPGDSVYFKGKVDSDIVFDYSDIVFSTSNGVAYECSDAFFFNLIRFISFSSFYGFYVSSDMSFSYPVVFKDSKGKVYDVSINPGAVSYSFSGAVNYSSAATAKCLVDDSTISGGSNPSDVLLCSLASSSLVISHNPDCPVKDGVSYFSYENGKNGCIFTTGATDLKCTFHVSFDFASK